MDNKSLQSASNIGLMNFIQSLLDSADKNVKVLFDLDAYAQPYTNGKEIHLPRTAIALEGEEQKKLRAYLTHQIAHTKYTDFEPSVELKDSPGLQRLWEEFIAVRADVLTVKEGYFGDTQALAYQEQFYKEEPLSLMDKMEDSIQNVTSAAVYLLTYLARKRVLDIQDKETEDAIAFLRKQKFFGRLGARILKYEERLYEIANIKQPRWANREAIALAEDILHEIKNSKDKEKQQQQQGSEAPSGQQQQKQQENKEQQDKSDDLMKPSNRFSSNPDGKNKSNIEIKSPPNTGCIVGISTRHVDFEVSKDKHANNTYKMEVLNKGRGLQSFHLNASPSIDKLCTNKLDQQAMELSRILIKKVKVLDRDRMVGNKRRGRLNSPALHKIMSHKLSGEPHQPKVFKKKVNRIIQKSCVTLLIDLSGSMSVKSKINTAIDSAYILAKALQILNIPFYIEGFTTRRNCSVNYIYMQPKHPKTYLQEVYKSMYAITHKYNMAGHMMMASNTDADSVYYAAQRLLKRKEKKKVMIVLSDGMPAGHDGHMHDIKSLKAVTAWLENIVHLHGIGIQTDAVKRFYTSSERVDSLDNLPKVILDKLSDSILPTVA